MENKILLNDDGDILLTTAILAKVLETSPKSIAAWHKAGMPKVKTGTWNLRHVLNWRGINSNAGNISDGARKLKADADYRESKAAQEGIKLAVEEGRFLSTEQVTADLKRLFMVLKKSLLAIGHNVAIELNSIDPESARIAKKIVDNVVYDALTQMSGEGQYVKKLK